MFLSAAGDALVDGILLDVCGKKIFYIFMMVLEEGREKMKKILLIVAMAMVLACGFGVKGADATPYLWTPSNMDVNFWNIANLPGSTAPDFGQNEGLGLIDDSVVLTSVGTFDFLKVAGFGSTALTQTVSFSKPSFFIASLDGSNKSINLGDSNTYQLGFYDGTDWHEVQKIIGAGNSYQIHVENNDGDIVNILQNDAHTTVPIPSAAWLLGSGLIGLIGIRRRRKK